MLKTSDHSGGDSAFQRSVESFVASEASGTPLGPEMPALAMRRLMCCSLEEISLTRFSSSCFEVTSHGPTLWVH